MKYSVWLSLVLMVFVSSCKKFRMEKGVPDCIEASAKEKTKSTKSNYATILEYEFQNQIVYVFDLNAGETDARADIYTASCSFFGYLGGPEKNTIVNGEDFKSAVFKRKVWPLKN